MRALAKFVRVPLAALGNLDEAAGVASCCFGSPCTQLALSDKSHSTVVLLSFGVRNFSSQTFVDTPKRQLDVYTKDDETQFIVTCTHSRDVGQFCFA